LPECTEILGKPGPVLVRLLEALYAIPEDLDTLTPPQVARELKRSVDTVRGWIRSGELKASNVAKPGKRTRYIVKRDDLDSFLAKRQPDKPIAKKRKPKLLVEKY